MKRQEMLHQPYRKQLGSRLAQRWFLLVVALTGTFLAILNAFSVTVALPAIQADLHMRLTETSLVLTVYTLVYAVALLAGGRLGDYYGHKRLFIIGMSSFIVTSTLCGLATTTPLLILGRSLQGLSAALIIPQVLSLIQIYFAPLERGTALGLYGLVIGMAAIVGQVIGGWSISANVLNLSWRSVFLLNLPCGLCALIAAHLGMPKSHVPRITQPDFVGASLVSISLALLMAPLIIGSALGWSVWFVGMLLLALPLFGLFLLHQHRRRVRGGIPFIMFSIFRIPTFTLGLLMVFVFYAGNAALFFTLTLYLQRGVGLSALDAGLAFLPLGGGFAAAALVAGHAVPRFGVRLVQGGALILIVGYGWISVTLPQFVLMSHQSMLVPQLLLTGIGMGLVSGALTHLVLADIPADNVGAAAGVLTTVTQLTSAFGVALIGVILTHALIQRAHDTLINSERAFQHAIQQVTKQPGVANTVIGMMHECVHQQVEEFNRSYDQYACLGPHDAISRDAAAQVRLILEEHVTHVITKSYVSAFGESLWWNMASALVTLLLALLYTTWAWSRAAKMHAD